MLNVVTTIEKVEQAICEVKDRYALFQSDSLGEPEDDLVEIVTAPAVRRAIAGQGFQDILALGHSTAEPAARAAATSLEGVLGDLDRVALADAILAQTPLGRAAILGSLARALRSVRRWRSTCDVPAYVIRVKAEDTVEACEVALRLFDEDLAMVHRWQARYSGVLAVATWPEAVTEATHLIALLDAGRSELVKGLDEVGQAYDRALKAENALLIWRDDETGLPLAE